jgi:hypothetical protein
MVLQILRYGDRLLYEAHPKLDTAPIFILNRIGYNITEMNTGRFPVTTGFDCVLLKLKGFSPHR